MTPTIKTVAKLCATLAFVACSGRTPPSRLEVHPAVATPDAATNAVDAHSLPYVIDNQPPKDFVDLPLIKTLKREANLVVQCQLAAFDDIFKDDKDLYVFLDVTCANALILLGNERENSIHFIWQVERGSFLPPPSETLLVFLKHRKQPISPPVNIKWVAVETGVVSFTPKVKRLATSLFPQQKKKT